MRCDVTPKAVTLHCTENTNLWANTHLGQRGATSAPLRPVRTVTTGMPLESPVRVCLLLRGLRCVWDMCYSPYINGHTLAASAYLMRLCAAVRPACSRCKEGTQRIHGGGRGGTWCRLQRCLVPRVWRRVWLQPNLCRAHCRSRGALPSSSWLLRLHRTLTHAWQLVAKIPSHRATRRASTGPTRRCRCGATSQQKNHKMSRGLDTKCRYIINAPQHLARFAGWVAVRCWWFKRSGQLYWALCRPHAP